MNRTWKQNDGSSISRAERWKSGHALARSLISVCPWLSASESAHVLPCQTASRCRFAERGEPGRGAVRPDRRRLDLFWIRALCRMCPPLNIRAAAEAGVVAMVAHTGSPHPFFYSRQRRHRDRRDTAGGRGLPPRRRRSGGVPGAADPRRAAGTPRAWPRRGRAGPAHADAARAQSSQPCPRLSRATATRSFSPRTSRTLLPRGPRAK